MNLPTLYHCTGARSLRCLWAAEEIGMQLNVQILRFPPREFEPEYRAVNPLMTVPGWVENGTLMTESVAICERIVDGTTLEVRRDENDYWSSRNWLHRSDSTLTFPLAIMLRYTSVEPPDRRLVQAVDDYKAFFRGRMRIVETSLADGREWLVAERFTIVDVAVGFTAYFASTLGIRDALGELTQSWLSRCMARSAFQRARMRRNS